MKVKGIHGGEIDVLMHFCLMDKFVSGKRGTDRLWVQGEHLWKGSWLCFFWGWEDFDMQFAGYILLVRPLLIPHSPVFVTEKPY